MSKNQGKTTKKDEAEETILNYINKHNRPFNSLMIETAHPMMGKAQINKLLKSLAEQDKIASKENNRTVLYWKKQSVGPKLDKEGYPLPEENVDDLKRKVDMFKKEHDSEKETLDQLIKQSKTLLDQPTNESLAKEIKELMNDNDEMEKKLKVLQSKGSGCSEQEKEKLIAFIVKARADWVKRKRIFKEALDAILERSNKKKKDLQEDIGWETDEDLKIPMIEDRSKLLNNNSNNNNSFKRYKRG
ncbi:hypothetical protein CYY_007277 [Polysphondylium violaceum]|uniref:Homologous-pairing protein 2 homolog n=1 Tax=Polysphondylium violaceum TaxID=133409 RepID=A0A8J4UY43_9MYCE|nr:hypothetical protein CYY_007277 [Polysphondylium violaceum]